MSNYEVNIAPPSGGNWRTEMVRARSPYEAKQVIGSQFPGWRIGSVRRVD